MARRASPNSPFRSGLEPFDIPMVQAKIADDAEGAEGGIGLRHVEHPLLVRLARPDGTPVGTAFELHWGPGSPVAFNTLQAGDENLLYIPFIVASDKILEDFADPVYVVIKRPSGNPTETRQLRLRVNLQRPGGRDPNPLPGNQNLNFELPLEVVLNGVDDVRAHAGVEVTFRYWEHMAAYDLLRLVWGSQIIERLIQPDEVNRDITLTVPYETILEAGDSEILPCAFQVIGPTGNFPDPWEPWSEVVHLSVYLQTDRLDAPWVEFPVTAGEIDLVPLGGQDVKIGVYVSSQDARDYSHLFLTWAGKNDQGGSVPHTDSLELASSAKSYSFDIPNALVAAIAKGSAVVFYTLESSTKPAKRSHNRHITVIGDVVRLPAPTVDEALADYLDPNLSKATIRFPAQLNWQASDWLQVVILSVGTDNPVEYVDSRVVGEIPPGGEMTFEVPGVELKRFDKRVIEVLYTITHGTELPQDSQRRAYQVGEPVRDMPAPDVEKALGGQLNPDDVLNGAKVTALFAQTKANDGITLYWSGRVSALPIRVQVPEDGKVMVFEVLYQYIEPNLNGGVSVFYTLERDGQPMRYSKITGLLIGRGLGELPPPALAKASLTGPSTATLAPLNAQGGSELVVSYDGMLYSDSIKVTMTGTAGAGSPNIAAKPGNAATGRVVFDITKAAIAANIGNVNKTVIFKYVVTRNGVLKDSQTLTVTVTPIPEASLRTVTIVQANEGTGVLDVNGLASATIRLANWPFIANNQRFSLELRGQHINGGRHDRVLYEYQYAWVAWLPNSYSDWEVYDYWKDLKDGTPVEVLLSVGLDLGSNINTAIVFPIKRYTVSSPPVIFPVPKLTEATGSGTSVTLAPMSAQNGGTVSVEYTPMYTTDSITVKMVGSAGAGSPVIAAKNGLTSGVVTFAIPQTAIAANIGNANKTFTLEYEVTRAGVKRGSTTLTVTVTPIPMASLPHPLINGIAHNGTLDVPNLPAHAQLTIAAWPLQYSGMKIWLTYHCGGANPNPYVIWTGQQHHTATGLEYGAPIDWLKTCPNGNQVWVDFKVAYDPNANEAEAVSLPRTVYTIKAISLADPPCSSAGYFRSVIPGQYYYCEWQPSWQMWLKKMLSCPAGKEFDNAQQRCI